MKLLLWVLMMYAGRHDGLEATDRLVPPGFVGNPWGPRATALRQSGELPPIVDTPEMKRWDQWGRQVLKTGDIVFRQGDARVLGGFFPFSRFTANITGSRYSHTGTVVIEDGEPVVYDTTNPSTRRQPFKVWILDNKGPFGAKRLKAPYRNRIPKVVEYVQRVYREQIKFDWELSPDDRQLYCLEMTEKAFRNAGLKLSDPVILADMENIQHFPLGVLGFTMLGGLKLDQAVFFPGNSRHGVWASPYLETIYESPEPPPRFIGEPGFRRYTRPAPSAAAPAVNPATRSVAGRPAVGTPRNE